MFFNDSSLWAAAYMLGDVLVIPSGNAYFSVAQGLGNSVWIPDEMFESWTRVSGEGLAMLYTFPLVWDPGFSLLARCAPAPISMDR